MPPSRPQPRRFNVDRLRVEVHADGGALGAAVSTAAAAAVADAIAVRGVANVMFATGNSQLEFLDAFMARPDVDWSRIVGFHMDEYIGIGPDHPASFARYIRERIVERASVPPRAFHLIDGLTDPAAEAARYTALLAAHPLDLVCMGVGENGHLAFNDPPFARFDDPVDLKVVTLDAASRWQQVGEGHFPDIDAVPETALTVTVPALLRAGVDLVAAPEARKAPAILAALTGPITTECPASILRETPHARLFLDTGSASRLPPSV
ncbi:MAG: glucosamine/galactosamine-6-phosphate isomerase [Actinomycetia bacterium]|nr:glucosamine/galactosamine-6-phosphate isomerase [Actinomycetes bacterium]